MPLAKKIFFACVLYDLTLGKYLKIRDEVSDERL